VRQRKTGALALGVTGLLASAMLTGCTPSGDVIDADYAQVCKDRKTEQRVDDNNCSEAGRSGGYYGWYFYQSGSSVPAVGSRATGGVDSIPGGTTAKSGTPSKGGTVTRGGFGSSAKGSSGG
jgi:hypothetical protein